MDFDQVNSSPKSGYWSKMKNKARTKYSNLKSKYRNKPKSASAKSMDAPKEQKKPSEASEVPAAVESAPLEPISEAPPPNSEASQE